MASITEQIDSWAKKAQIWAIWLLTFITTILAISGVVFFFFDVQTSYRGWGKLAETHTSIGENSFALAMAISLLPTLFQAAWVVAKTSGVKFVSDHKILSGITLVMFVFDTALDTYQLFDSEKGIVSLLVSFVIAFVIFGMCSEFLLSFFLPIAVTLWQNVFVGVNWDFVSGMSPNATTNEQENTSEELQHRRERLRQMRQERQVRLRNQE